jgi:hypothetical protein
MKKIKKGPLNVPERGDKCILRGKSPIGILKTMDNESLWCVVEWENSQGPKYCHLFELEKISW